MELKLNTLGKKLIFNLYKDKLIFSEKEINEELNIIIKQQQGLEEYDLAEIEILLIMKMIKIKKLKILKSNK